MFFCDPQVITPIGKTKGGTIYGETLPRNQTIEQIK